MLELGVAVASVYDDDGFLGIQVDTHGDNDAGVPPFQALMPYGLLGRPLDPESTGEGCNVVFWPDGDESHCIALNDPRIAAVAPQATKGSTGLCNARGAFQLLDYDSETLTIYVPLDDGDRAHVITIGKDDNGADYLGIVQCNGLAVSMLDDELVIKNRAGTAYIQVDDEGIILNGNVKLVGGLDVGGGTALPLVLAPAMLTWMNAVASAVGGIPTGGPAAGAAIALATTAFSGPGQTTLTKGL
jgi:hypothetical protein